MNIKNDQIKDTRNRKTGQRKFMVSYAFEKQPVCKRRIVVVVEVN